MPVFALGTALGALLAYFFDPQNGKRRRHVTVDRTAAFLRRSKRPAQAVAAQAHGVSQKVQHLQEEPKEFDDATLANKVRSEVFRPEDVPKGQVDVNVQNGVVQLRGEVPRPEMISDLVEQVRKVQGVRDVENLLHLPGTQAPMHQ
jgi:osmotically-inducible protein OsmY